MTNVHLRVWQPFDLRDVEEHLIVLGDCSGNCAKCRELGIDPWVEKECPACHTKFTYITTRRFATHPAERFRFARRVLENRPDLRLVDYEDYQKAVGSRKAKDFFKS